MKTHFEHGRWVWHFEGLTINNGCEIYPSRLGNAPYSEALVSALRLKQAEMTARGDAICQEHIAWALNRLTAETAPQ